MALDAYSYCPGGRGKKIRFCCPDMVKEIQQMEKMMEDEQNAACLAFIEQLEKNHPDCACLTAAKLSMLRTQERWNESLEVAEMFYQREPDNPLAASELAMSYAFSDRWEDAISTIIDGIERWEESSIHVSLLTGLLVVGEKALADGNVIAALSIARQLQMFTQTAEQGQSLYFRSLRSELPLIAKDMVFNPDCPSDFPALESFQRAANYVISARWKKGLAILESLVSHANLWPELWKNIALLRLCLGNISGAAEALGEFTRCENCEREDAADAELLRMCMIPDPLGDMIELLSLVCSVNDGEKVQEILLSDKRFISMDFNPRVFIETGTPPPKNAFCLLDRPLVDPQQELTLENISSQLGDCILFGKETDRDARVELINIRSNEKDRILAQIQDCIGPCIVSWEEPVPMGSFSRTFLSLKSRFVLGAEHQNTLNEKREQFVALFQDCFISDWCGTPLGFLDGKTPGEAAKDPAYHVRILGAIEVIDFWLTGNRARDLCNPLRRTLGLPTLESIRVPERFNRDNVSQKDLEELKSGIVRETFLNEVPIWRWYRVEMNDLPLNALVQGLHESLMYDEVRASLSFSGEIMKFPCSEVPYPLRREALRQMIHKAQSDADLVEMEKLLEQGKKEAAENHASDAWINVMEIPMYLARGEDQKAQRTISHIVSAHGEDPEAMQMLQSLFISMGFLNPDGTPVDLPAAYPDSSASVEPGQSPQSGSKLWVPD